MEVKWLDEIHEHCPGVKLCLVALKCDLREDQPTKEKLSRLGEVPVSYEEVRLVDAEVKAERIKLTLVCIWTGPSGGATYTSFAVS